MGCVLADRWYRLGIIIHTGNVEVWCPVDVARSYVHDKFESLDPDHMGAVWRPLGMLDPGSVIRRPSMQRNPARVAHDEVVIVAHTDESTRD